MDSEFKKLLAGATWAQDGDRVDMDDTSVQPTIDRSEGFPLSFSSYDTPSRARFNQILRELGGGAKEVLLGVSEYDAEVAYPQGSLTQVAGDLYYANAAHDPSSPISPLDTNQSTWANVGGRTAGERTVPSEVPVSDIFIDGSQANRFSVWWNAPDSGGHPITSTQIRYSKDQTFPSASTTTISYEPGDEVSIAARDSDLYYVSVRSTNSLGNSPWSAPKRVASGALVPGPVQFFYTFTTSSPGRVQIRYLAPETHGLSITEYRIQWKSGAQDYPSVSSSDRTSVQTTEYPSSGVSLSLSGFDPNTAYTFRVVAVSNRGTASVSNRERTVTPRGSAIPPTVLSIATQAVSATSMRAYNGNNILTVGATFVLNFQFRYRKVTTPASSWTTRPASSESAIFVQNLERGETYEFAMRAQTDFGWSEWTSPKSQPPWTPTIPSSPKIAVESSETIVANSLKGVVSFSMGQLSRPEEVKDRITQTAVRWRIAANTNDPWTEESSALFDDLDENNFNIPQIFPATGSIPVGQALSVQARWRNSGNWSEWSSTTNLTAATAPSGNLALSSSSITMNEGTTATLSVKLSRAPVSDTTVTATSSNSALTISPASLTFTGDNWDTNQSFTLTAAADANDQDEAAAITLAVSGGLDISDDTVYVTIRETLQLLVSGDTITPENRPAYFTVGLSRAPDTAVQVSIAKANADDNITLSLSSITFNANNWTTSRQVTVTTAADSDSVDTDAIVNFGATGGLTQQVSRTVTLKENTLDEAQITRTSPIEVAQGFSTGTVNSLLLNRAPSNAFHLRIRPLHPTITVTPTSRTFTLANWNDPQYFDVSVSSSAPAGLRSYIMLEPENVTNVRPTFSDVYVTSPIVTLYNSISIPEGGRLGFSDSVGIGSGRGTTYGFRTKLGAAPSSNVTITPTSANSDLSFYPSSLTFTSTNWDTNQGFYIRAATDSDIVDDAIPMTLTATGGISSSLSIPTTITESNNSFQSFPSTIEVVRGIAPASFFIYLLNSSTSSNISIFIDTQESGSVSGVSLSGSALSPLIGSTVYQGIMTSRSISGAGVTRHGVLVTLTASSTATLGNHNLTVWQDVRGTNSSADSIPLATIPYTIT